VPEQGTIYGPAFTRITRTPISFGTVPEGNEGIYNPPTKLADLISSVPILRNFLNQSGLIRVDPSKGNVPRTTRHEEVHALLDPLMRNGQLQQLNRENPNYFPNTLSLDKGDPNTEVPAYAATEVANPFSTAYLDELKRQFYKLDPIFNRRLDQLRSK